MEKDKDIKVMTIRMDSQLHQTVTELAQKNTRTFNLEVQALLKKAIEIYEEDQEIVRQYREGASGKDQKKRNA